MAGGRPSKYSPALAAKVCEAIAEGQSLRAVCAAEDMPAKSTVYLWLLEQPGFSDQYARACEDRAHALVEDALEIADDGRNDYMAALGEGEDTLAYRLNGEHVQRSKLRVDTRKWFAARLAPKKYGDKIETTVQGGDKPQHHTFSWASSPGEATSDPSAKS